MNLVPCNKQIILIVPPLTDELIGGIILPASAQSKPSQGIVFKSDDEGFAAGEILVYRKYSGFQFTHDDTEYLIIEPGDVLIKMIETPAETEARINKPKIVIPPVNDPMILTNKNKEKYNLKEIA